MIFRIAIFLLVVFVCSSCANNTPRVSNDAGLSDDSGVSDAKIKMLKVGMGLDEVVEALQPASPCYGSCPTVVYKAADGGYYCLYLAYNLKKDDATLTLGFVVYCPVKSESKPWFVVPANMYGQEFVRPKGGSLDPNGWNDFVRDAVGGNNSIRAESQPTSQPKTDGNEGQKK